MMDTRDTMARSGFDLRLCNDALDLPVEESMRKLRYAASERRAAYQLLDIAETKKLQQRRAYAAMVKEMIG
jgi:hypothetical protein